MNEVVAHARRECLREQRPLAQGNGATCTWLRPLRGPATETASSTVTMAPLGRDMVGAAWSPRGRRWCCTTGAWSARRWSGCLRRGGEGGGGGGVGSGGPRG